jgi:hypothetical protein
MAKKKRSAALFEVMVKQEQRRLPRPPGMFRTLYLWFKNRPKAAPAPLVTSVVEREEAVERVITEAPPAPAPMPILREVEYVPPPRPQPTPVDEEQAPRPVRVQREGGWLALRMSYGTAMITAFAVATVVISAFLIGKRWQNRPQTVLAPTTSQELRRQAPRANLTDVRRVSNPPAVQYTADPPELSNNVATTGTNVAGNAPAKPKDREVGLNYVMIQSYPEEKMAVAAAAALRQNGIDCTIERGVPGFFRFGVVGQIGFSRISNNPQLEAYLNKIRAISDSYAKKPSSFAAFKPQPIKWQNWVRKAD